MRCDRPVAFVLTCSLLLSGCTSTMRMQPATAPDRPVNGRLEPGDTVVVQTREGVHRSIVVVQIDGDFIVAPDGTRFARQDVVRFKRRALSGTTKAILIVGTAAVVVILAVGYWLTKNSR